MPLSLKILQWPKLLTFASRNGKHCFLSLNFSLPHWVKLLMLLQSTPKLESGGPAQIEWQSESFYEMKVKVAGPFTPILPIFGKRLPMNAMPCYSKHCLQFFVFGKLMMGFFPVSHGSKRGSSYIERYEASKRDNFCLKREMMLFCWGGILKWLLIAICFSVYRVANCSKSLMGSP